MATYRVHITYNRPMYGTVYLETPNDEEVTNWTMDNFCYNNLDCISMEEDFHSDQTYEIEEYDGKWEKKNNTTEDWWYIDSTTGEQLERPEPEQLESNTDCMELK